MGLSEELGIRSLDSNGLNLKRIEPQKPHASFGAKVASFAGEGLKKLAANPRWVWNK
jgi:hypothetical protein